MKFRSREEFKETMVATVLYLPEMIRLYEDGLQLLGAKVLKKYVYRSKDGEIAPAYLIEYAGKQFNLRLGNAMKEILSVDRKEKPLHFGYRIDNPA